MWVTNFTNRSAVALRMVTSLLFPRKLNINTELDAGRRGGEGWSCLENEDAFGCGFLWHRGFVSWLQRVVDVACVMFGCRGELRHRGMCPEPGELLQSRDLCSHPVLSIPKIMDRGK